MNNTAMRLPTALRVASDINLPPAVSKVMFTSAPPLSWLKPEDAF